MFRFFTTDPKRKLEKKFEALMSEGHRLAEINHSLSQKKYTEANRVLKQIETDFET